MNAAWQLELGRRWTEPHRQHHGIDHLREVLDALALLAEDGLVFDHDDTTAAAWFHDAVYDVRRDDNEERSASLARRLVGGDRGERVAGLVLVTKDHVVPPGDAEAAALCDADLSVLGSAPARYRRYADGIRHEYGHVPTVEFARGRSEILQGLLDHPSIFVTAPGRDRWEEIARRNVSDEVDALRSGSAV